VTPGTLSFTSATNGTLGTFFGVRTLTFAAFTGASETSVVTVTNTGAGSLSITAETLALNGGGRFSVTGNTCTFLPLAPGGTCTISLKLTGTAADMGVLSTANNGSGTIGGATLLGLVH